MTYGRKSRKELEREVPERRDRFAVAEELLQAIEQAKPRQANSPLEQELLDRQRMKPSPHPLLGEERAFMVHGS